MNFEGKTYSSRYSQTGPRIRRCRPSLDVDLLATGSSPSTGNIETEVDHLPEIETSNASSALCHALGAWFLL